MVYLVVSDESDEGVHVLVVDALAPLSEPEDAHLDRPAMSQHQEVEVEDPYTYEQAGMQDSVLAQVEVRSSGRARTPSQPRPCVARVSWGPGHTSRLFAARLLSPKNQWNRAKRAVLAHNVD